MSTKPDDRQPAQALLKAQIEASIDGGISADLEITSDLDIVSDVQSLKEEPSTHMDNTAARVTK